MVNSEKTKAACKRGSRNAKTKIAAMCAMSAAIGIWPAASVFQRTGAHSSGPAQRIAVEVSHAGDTASKQQATPFRTGEILKYRVEWAAFSNAASVEMSVPERRNLYGWQTWHFRALIHTLSPVRSLFQIDDQFDSYTDAGTFESRQFEEHLNEMGRRQEQVMHFAAAGDESRGPGPTVVVLQGTRDPLDALYDLRTIDWQRTPEFRAPVYDGKNLYQMIATRDSADEAVTVAAGNFSTSRISIRLIQYQKEVSGIHFEIWMANNAARTPVLLRADLPFGNLRSELISATN